MRPQICSLPEVIAAIKGEPVTVIPIHNPSLLFDFEKESKMAAVNEACMGTLSTCSTFNLCPECEALAHQICLRLERAFMAGQASMQRTGDEVIS